MEIADNPIRSDGTETHICTLCKFVAHIPALKTDYTGATLATAVNNAFEGEIMTELTEEMKQWFSNNKKIDIDLALACIPNAKEKLIEAWERRNEPKKVDTTEEDGWAYDEVNLKPEKPTIKPIPTPKEEDIVLKIGRYYLFSDPKDALEKSALVLSFDEETIIFWLNNQPYCVPRSCLIRSLSLKEEKEELDFEETFSTPRIIKKATR